jgi:hypothetical protein
MTIRANAWYRVKATHQYCFVQKIPSSTDPRISVPTANENTRGFEVALTWYAPVDDANSGWTKRVMILSVKKAAGLFREPGDDDQPILARIKEKGTRSRCRRPAGTASSRSLSSVR